MSSTLAKLLLPAIRPLLPYLPLLPKPLLTLPPSLFLHYTSQPQLSLLAYLRDPFTHPLHPPLLLTFLLIPLIYTLGHISGNVSWVDRLWPFYTPVHSGLLLLWACMNEGSGIYGHNLPRLAVMMFLQASLLSLHAFSRETITEMRTGTLAASDNIVGRLVSSPPLPCDPTRVLRSHLGGLPIYSIPKARPQMAICLRASIRHWCVLPSPLRSS